jgi:hypothetical protein
MDSCTDFKVALVTKRSGETRCCLRVEKKDRARIHLVLNLVEEEHRGDGDDHRKTDTRHGETEKVNRSVFWTDVRLRRTSSMLLRFGWNQVEEKEGATVHPEVPRMCAEVDRVAGDARRKKPP